MPELGVEQCAFRYNGRPVLSGVSLTVGDGEFVALCGPNGAGKSTLLRLISGALAPSNGKVALGGTPVANLPVRELARVLAVVPQETRFQFPYTVEEVIRMGRTPYLGYWGFEGDADIEATERALADVRMESLRHRMMFQLSGGEKQRAIVGRALAQEPELLLLDEPTQNLDPRHAAEIFEILRRIHQGGISVLVVTHDLNLAARYADRMILLNNGSVEVQGRPDEVMNPEILQNLFGIEMRVVDGPDGRPAAIPGSPSN
jgi:iron complex transport system ATP-binding protein